MGWGRGILQLSLNVLGYRFGGFIGEIWRFRVNNELNNYNQMAILISS